MEMLYGCPFEKITFLPRIDKNSGFGRVWDTLWKKFNNGTFIALQMKVLGNKIFQIPSKGSKVPNWQFLKWLFFPVYGIWIFLTRITFIWSAINVPLLNLWHFRMVWYECFILVYSSFLVIHLSKNVTISGHTISCS